MPLRFILRQVALVAPVVIGLSSTTLATEPLEMLPDGSARARIGDIKLYHDPKAWRIDGEGDAFAIRCRGPECDGPLMSISIEPADRSACTPGAVVDRSHFAYPDAWGWQVTRGGGAVGLPVHIATSDWGCRNLAGFPVFACTEHKGRSYWFAAPGDMCQTSRRESQGLRNLLNGLSAAELTDP